MRRFYAAKVLLVGLFAAQVLATIQVYLSNERLYRTLMAIKGAGYLPIPNQHVMKSLQECGPAFFGGLFFSLSVGAGLSLLSLAAAWIWDRFGSRNKLLLILFMLLWIGCLVKANWQGFCPMVTAYFLVLPPVTFMTTLKWMPEHPKHTLWLSEVVHLLPILLLALLWSSQMDTHLFVDFRDSLLLTNPLGQKSMIFTTPIPSTPQRYLNH